MTYYIASSGRKINIETISENDITLSDIAHHLTKICRYGGALDLNLHYSVANHSIALFYYCLDQDFSIEVQRAALMHDASEAYLGDIVAGLKQFLPDYQAIEHKIESLIRAKYNILFTAEIQAKVKEIDTRILLDEAVAFMPEHYNAFAGQLGGIEPLGIRIHPDPAPGLSATKAMFLHCCDMIDIFD